MSKPAARQTIAQIAPYVPGSNDAPGRDPVTGKLYKLSSNESPLGPSPKAIEAVQNMEAFQDYPDGSAGALRAAIGAKWGLNPERIVCGAGSDEILSLLANTFLSAGDEAIYSEHGFLVYHIAILAAGATPVIAPEKDETAQVDALLAAVTPKTKMIFLANPNNPTGTYLPFDEVKRLHEGLRDDIVLVLDAAYAEYVRKNDYEAGVELVSSAQNVVMTRTFSKIFALANLRIGWCFAPEDIIDAVNRIRGPFNVNGPSIAAGVAALEDKVHLQASIEHNEIWYEKLVEGLEGINLRVTPSVGNFLLVHFPENSAQSAAAADQYLQSQGLVLRAVAAYGFPNALRLTIGTEEANEALLIALKKFMR